MAISISCPTCGKAYNLNESLVGKKVRCKHCADTFPVEIDSVLPTGDAAAARATQFRGDPAASPPPPLLAPISDEDLPEVVKAPDGAKEKEPKKSGFPVFLCVTAGVAFVILLLCGGIGAGAFLIVRNIYQTANNIANIANNPQSYPDPPKVMTIADAVASLNSGTAARQQQGAEWLAKEPVNPLERSKVAKALEPLLNDVNPSVKTAAANALVTWAGSENVPALIRCVETEDQHTVEPAVKALVKVGNPKAVPAIAKLLPTGRRGIAVAALQSLGPMSESEVVKYAFHPEQGTRDEAQRLLRGYKTKDEVLVVQATADLKAPDAGRRTSAALWLSQAAVLAKFRDDVSAALNPVLHDANEGARHNAIKAVRVWATAANVPALVELMGEAWKNPFAAREMRGLVVATLTDLKDKRATAAFCKDLTTRDWNAQAEKALETIGRDAEPEVVKYAFHPDDATRQRVAGLLKAYGTKPEVLVTQAVVDLQSNDNGRRRSVAEWLAQTAVIDKQRDAVSEALNPLLKDNNKNDNARNAAVHAVRVWATKANVPTIIEMLNNKDWNHPGLRELRGTLVATLADLKDERAAAVFAKGLGADWRMQATAALEALGSVAEPEVLKCLHDRDSAIRNRAAALLAKYGTKEDAFYKQAMADITSTEAGTRQGAAMTLAGLKLDDKKRPDVSAALEPLLNDKDRNVVLAATKAARVWATKDNVPSLVTIITARFADHRQAEQVWVAVEVLIDLKDERAYWPIAQYAGHPFEHEKGRMYLEKIGAAAEAEVIKHLADNDEMTRQRAWKAVAIIGTKGKLMEYQAQAMREKNFTGILAKQAIKAITERK